MAITGKRKVEEQIIPATEIDERVCDYCGTDATGRTRCGVCQKDLCGNHQIDVYRMSSGKHLVDEEISGIFCKNCLIAEINKRFS